MKVFWCFFMIGLCGVLNAQCPKSGPNAEEVIRCRYLVETIPEDRTELVRMQHWAEDMAHSMKPDGTWPDVDYVSQLRSEWPAAEHLDRVLIIAKAAYSVREGGHSNAALEAGALRGLRYWLAKDPTNPNWWWNQIGTQQLLGEIGLLMTSRMTPDDFGRLLPILKRSEWSNWTGANLVWGVTNQILRGVLYHDADAVTEGYSRLYEEVRKVPDVLPNGKPGEGIQADNSFHQHGAQFYSGGYGLDFSNYAARYITYSWGTSLQIPADKMEIFMDFLLDGQQWMIRGDIFDYAAVGREITRKDEAAVQHSWVRGPIAGYDAAYTLANVIDHLAELPVPRQPEVRAFADRLNDRSSSTPLAGNRMFWDSDYMTHRRSSYSTSVKMFSTRIQNSEITNSEGRWSTHLSDGMNLLYLTGDEYRGIFAGWDWALVPGTTAIHEYRSDGTPDTGEISLIDGRGKSDFVGGVSDGMYGIAAMNLERGALSTKKAWFFFDSFYVAVGAGVSIKAPSVSFVATDINQTLLRSKVVTNLSPNGLSNGVHRYKPGKLRYVHHNNVGYVLGRDLDAVLSTGLARGRWSDFGAGSDAVDRIPVFNLWIDHGAAPQGSEYEYEVLPNATATETAVESAHPSYDLLSNTEDLQAVFVRERSVVALVARKPIEFATPLGIISVDKPSLVMIRKDAAGFTFTAANPRNQPMSLRVNIDSRWVALQLPDGSTSGSSISAHLDR